MDGQGTKCRRNIAENYNRLSRVHERYRQTTDGGATTYSERSLKRTISELGTWDRQTDRRRDGRMGALLNAPTLVTET